MQQQQQQRQQRPLQQQDTIRLSAGPSGHGYPYSQYPRPVMQQSFASTWAGAQQYLPQYPVQPQTSQPQQPLTRQTSTIRLDPSVPSLHHQQYPRPTAQQTAAGYVNSAAAYLPNTYHYPFYTTTPAAAATTTIITPSTIAAATTRTIISPSTTATAVAAKPAAAAAATTAAKKEPVKVLITGAAGQIAYSLIFNISRGLMFGPAQPVILHLLDIAPAMDALKGVVMEIQDCAHRLVHGIVATSDVAEAFDGIDYALFVGAMPRKQGMERKDLLKANASIFSEQGKALDSYAKKTCKSCVVGNPANTNCLILMKNAPSIPKENFSALTRLDHNRAKAMLAERLKVTADSVCDVVIFGNHSATQYPCVDYAVVVDAAGAKQPIRDSIDDDDWLNGEFIGAIQQRGAAVIAARKLSSAASAASAITDHMHDWVLGSSGEIVSMAVPSDGSYGIHEGLIYSYPVRCAGGKYEIVKGLAVSDFSRKLMDETMRELDDEAAQSKEFIAPQ